MAIASCLSGSIASYSTYLMVVAGKMKGHHLQSQEGISNLVQRTLVTALGVIRDENRQISFETDAELKAWLVGVLKNTYKHLIRHYTTRKRTSVVLPPPPDSPSPSTLAIMKEELQTRTQALESLDPGDRCQATLILIPFDLY